ncbi:MAG: hypothetical protein LQ350_005944 [Teloschistes chrysophthalmus]|nr:MAG: hypothetical protein LQ350_005944 [Niorma chrysophthalma]
MLSKTLLLPFFAATSSFISSVAADLDEYKSPNGTTIWDEAPNFKNDPIQPYPDLKGPNGEDLTIENLRGVHLFGYKGCSGQESVWIKEAYSDFYKLAQQPELYNNIDWSDEAIKEFFGPNSNAYKIPPDTRAEIQQIFAAAQQVYNQNWLWEPPWLGWRRLWIEKDSKSPEVFDAQFRYKTGKQTYTAQAYGPFWAKTLRNYIPKPVSDIGYYTQRNETTRYPPNPNPGKFKPIGRPTKSPGGEPLFASDIGPDEEGDTADDALIGQTENTDHAPGFHIPRCGDKYKQAGTIDPPPPQPTQQPDPPQPRPVGEPGHWHYKYGDASKGQWAIYIQPGRTVGSKKSRRSSTKFRRVILPEPRIPPTPAGPSADANLITWIQAGANSKQFGPLKINCKKPQGEWQNFDPKDTGLKYSLSIKSGHACTLKQADRNMDYVGLKYANIGDMSVSSDGRCFKAENSGVSCVIKIDP